LEYNLGNTNAHVMEREKINFIEETVDHPFTGLVRPEPTVRQKCILLSGIRNG